MTNQRDTSKPDTHRNINAKEKDFAYLQGVFGLEAIMLKKGKNPRHPFLITFKLPF